MIGVAGTAWRVKLIDGRALDVHPTTSDEVRFERLAKTSLSRATSEDGVPVWLVLGILHVRLLRDGADVPQESDDFTDLVDDFEQVDEGKAEGTAPIPPTG